MGKIKTIIVMFICVVILSVCFANVKADNKITAITQDAFKNYSLTILEKTYSGFQLSGNNSNFLTYILLDNLTQEPLSEIDGLVVWQVLYYNVFNQRLSRSAISGNNGMTYFGESRSYGMTYFGESRSSVYQAYLKRLIINPVFTDAIGINKLVDAYIITGVHNLTDLLGTHNNNFLRENNNINLINNVSDGTLIGKKSGILFKHSTAYFDFEFSSTEQDKFTIMAYDNGLKEYVNYDNVFTTRSINSFTEGFIEYYTYTRGMLSTEILIPNFGAADDGSNTYKTISNTVKNHFYLQVYKWQDIEKGDCTIKYLGDCEHIKFRITITDENTYDLTIELYEGWIDYPAGWGEGETADGNIFINFLNEHRIIIIMSLIGICIFATVLYLSFNKPKGRAKRKRKAKRKRRR